MDKALYFQTLINMTRPRVYLLWAVLTGIGYTATHFYQHPNINIVWTILVVIGFGYMYMVMPLRVKQMRQIFLAWLVPITIGIAISVISVRTDLLPSLVPYLGVFWLGISAIGYYLNGTVDPPAFWYNAATVLNLLAVVVCTAFESLLDWQYIIAAAVTVVSMLSLWLFRGDA